jgi:hypothetical protein
MNEELMTWRVYESSIRSKIEEQLNELEDMGYEIKHILHVSQGDVSERVWIFARVREA